MLGEDYPGAATADQSTREDPRLVITGVTRRDPQHSPSRFDWYAATLEADAPSLIALLARNLGAEPREARGINGYKQSFELRRGDLTVGRVLTGGHNGNRPHAFASGADAVAFAEIVRREYPEHRVTRFDSATDFDGPGAFDRLTATALVVADSLGITVNHAGDWHRAVEGRTLYIGSRKSSVFVRIYEKGKQLGSEYSPDWVRVEVVVRPERDSREIAATATPAEAWGFGGWTRELARRLLDIDVPRVAISERREADDDRSLRAMTEQYWRVLERRAGVAGSWEALGRELGQLIGGLR